MSEFHRHMVRTLKKPGADIQSTLTSDEADALHMVIGVCGEAGELADAIKKWAIYRKDLDIANVIEELGDLEFFLEGIRQIVGVSREETLQANIAKLKVRYDGLVYSDQRAQDRADKA